MSVAPERRGYARTAGLLYAVVVATGMFSLGHVPSRVIVPGDAAATVRALTAHEGLFRAGLAASVACYVAFLLLPLALHRLLAPAGPAAAALMVAFAAVSVPLSFAAVAHRAEVLALLADPGLGGAALEAEVARALRAYGNGLLVAKVFWGLWLLPLGWLVWRSRAVPRALGVLLALGCAGYLLEVFGKLLTPEYAGSTLARLATLPAALGELGTCLALLVVGFWPERREGAVDPVT